MHIAGWCRVDLVTSWPVSVSGYYRSRTTDRLVTSKASWDNVCMRLRRRQTKIRPIPMATFVNSLLKSIGDAAHYHECSFGLFFKAILFIGGLLIASTITKSIFIYLHFTWNFLFCTRGQVPAGAQLVPSGYSAVWQKNASKFFFGVKHDFLKQHLHWR